ncbi:MAG: hypothetical protein JWP61_344 [Friedmanniella sp.]|nr:hypothetical protein [Friedmanniella sp.]
MSVSVPDLVVAAASIPDAPAMVEVIHAAFGARPALDPPSTAIHETPESVAAVLERAGGVYATVGGRPAGVILVVPGPSGLAGFQRVSVHPEFQRHGIASAMVAAAERLAAEQGQHGIELFARAELAEVVAFWRHRGFRIDRRVEHGVMLAKALPLTVAVATGAAMQELGVRLAQLLQPGDLLIASGDLGAGKTTLTQGIGRGLASEGPVISPTFVLSRVHRSTGDRPALVHVDAYRLSSPYELDDLDLDATLDASVTVVEWGRGMAEELSEDRLEIDIVTPAAEPDPAGETPRLVTIRPRGRRWTGVDLRGLQGVSGG